MVTAFLVGWLSLPHCYGMCGGIAGALSMTLAPDIRVCRGRLAGFTLLYGLGRIASYTLAGAISGFAGQVFGHVLHPILVGTAMRGLAAILVAAIGAHVAGWLPRLAYLERIGDPVWRRLWPLAQALLPVRTPGQAWLAGFFWGWLPCGLVYSMLMLAALSGSPLDGAALLFAFGSGTLPGLWLGGVLAGRFSQLRNMPWVRPAAGLVLMMSGLIALWPNVFPGPHTHGLIPD